MTRRMITMWFPAIAAVVLTACGAPVQSSDVGATDDSVREAPTENEEQAEPNVADEPADAEVDSTQEGGDGEPPWHMLPEDDQPEPIEQPKCERGSPTPVAC